MSQLATVVVSVVLAGLTSWAVAGRTLAWERQKWQETADREHVQWLREKRYDAYRGFIRDAGAFVLRIRTATTEQKFELLGATNTAMTDCQAIGPGEIGMLIAEFGVAIGPAATSMQQTKEERAEANTKMIRAFTMVSHAMRRELTHETQ